MKQFLKEFGITKERFLQALVHGPRKSACDHAITRRQRMTP